MAIIRVAYRMRFGLLSSVWPMELRTDTAKQHVGLHHLEPSQYFQPWRRHVLPVEFLPPLTRRPG